MLLKTSISKTKKFFQKTIENLKSFVSRGYQRLPKTPPCTPFPSNEKSMKFTTARPTTNDQVQKREDQEKKRIVNKGKGKEKEELAISTCKGMMREERSCLVAQKLKELEKMDFSNVEHVLDIEEVLHYYSRLTCPAYRDIVDKFFMEMHSEFSNL